MYVTHDQVEAMTMADRIAVMSPGRLQQVGTPQEVYEAPANLFVAQFIGTPPMNTLAGTFTSDGGARGRRRRRPGAARAWPAAGWTRAGRWSSASGPSTWSLTPGGPIEQGVRAVEWLGHECLVFGTVGGAAVVVRQAGMAGVAAGDTARLAVEPADVHLFDPETTERLT